jgi:hypothetical protein
VCSIVVVMLGRSTTEAFWVEVVDEMVTKFRKHEQRFYLEKPGVRDRNIILGPPSSLA